jgi:hypothetical protein
VANLLERFSDIAFWWGSPVELASALARRRGDSSLSQLDFVHATAVANKIWSEGTQIGAEEQVRTEAIRLLRLYSVPAAGALQLAALLILQGKHQPVEFVCFDKRLREAALLEGVQVLP